MTEVLGVPMQAFAGQLLIGLLNGGLYAMLSVGMAVILRTLHVVNLAHGAFFMMGAFCALLLEQLDLGYWWALLISPLAVGIIGIVLERTTLSRLYNVDPLYSLLLTFGLALAIQGTVANYYGSSGQPYPVPREFVGGRNLGFMFLPMYRAWVIVLSLIVCLATWLLLERTRLRQFLRIAENHVRMKSLNLHAASKTITLTYGFGVALAALAGVTAAPIYSVSPQMGADLIIVVMAVMIIGGSESIPRLIVTAFGLGLIEALTRVFYPEASKLGIFAVMILVLYLRENSFNRRFAPVRITPSPTFAGTRHVSTIGIFTLATRIAMILVLLPLLGLDPGLLMRCMCFALFACALNVLFRFGGLLSLGHAMFFGVGGYTSAYLIKWGLAPELAILFGMIAAMGMGIVTGAFALRSPRILFPVVMLATAQLVFFFCLDAPFTEGEDGIQAVPHGQMLGVLNLGNRITLYYVVVSIFVCGFLAAHLVVRQTNPSSATTAWEVSKPTRGDRGEKFRAYVLSAALAGLAGSTKVIVLQLATLTDVHWITSAQGALMMVLGGPGTIMGPIVGAFVFVALEGSLASWGNWMGIVGGALVLCVLFLRRGIVGELGAWWSRWSH